MIQNNRSVIGRLHFSEFSCVFQLFHDRGPYHIETSPNWSLYDRYLCHEKLSCILKATFIFIIKHTFLFLILTLFNLRQESPLLLK